MRVTSSVHTGSYSVDSKAKATFQEQSPANSQNQTHRGQSFQLAGRPGRDLLDPPAPRTALRSLTRPVLLAQKSRSRWIQLRSRRPACPPHHPPSHSHHHRRSTHLCYPAGSSPASTSDGYQSCERIGRTGSARCTDRGRPRRPTTMSSRTSCFTRDCCLAWKWACLLDSSCRNSLGECVSAAFI